MNTRYYWSSLGIIAPFILLLIGCATPCAAEDPTEAVPDVLHWSDLEHSLTSYVQEHSLEGLDSAPVVARIRSTKNRLLWSAMLQQGQRPLVQVAGFYSFAREDPDETKHAALVALAAAEHPASDIYAALYQAIQQRWAPEEVSAIDRFATRATEKGATAIGVAAIPVTVLENWLTASNSSLVVNVDLYALALEYVITEGAGRDRKWHELLRQLRAVPGLPRIVYLLHVPNPDPTDVRLATEVLVQPDLNEMDFVLLAKRYVERVDLDELKTRMTESRRETLDRIQGRQGEGR